MINWRRPSVQDVTEPSELVSHAEPGPRCYRRKVHSLLYFFLQQEERNPASQMSASFPHRAVQPRLKRSRARQT